MKDVFVEMWYGLETHVTSLSLCFARYADIVNTRLADFLAHLLEIHAM